MKRLLKENEKLEGEMGSNRTRLCSTHKAITLLHSFMVLHAMLTKLNTVCLVSISGDILSLLAWHLLVMRAVEIVFTVRVGKVIRLLNMLNIVRLKVTCILLP